MPTRYCQSQQRCLRSDDKVKGSMQQFDAIVVGAGPAGSSAALAMARAGLQVALIERGEYPGAKNVSGAALYAPNLLADLLQKTGFESPCVSTLILTHIFEKGLDKRLDKAEVLLI